MGREEGKELGVGKREEGEDGGWVGREEGMDRRRCPTTTMPPMPTKTVLASTEGGEKGASDRMDRPVE